NSAVVRSEVLVEGSVSEHMVDDAQHRGGDGDDRLLVTEARFEAEVSRPEAGVLYLYRRQGRLDEHGFQPGRALAQTPRALSAGAFVEPRTHAGPGKQMVGRGEGAHIDADLGDHGLHDVVADAGNFLQAPGVVAKGSEGSLQPRVELRDRGFDLLDRLQNAAAAPAQDVGNDRGQLDVGLLQRRLNPLSVTDDLARQLTPRAGQVAQVLDRLRRHEAGPDQPVGEKVGDPGRVIGVALTARHVAYVRGVGENQA